MSYHRPTRPSGRVMRGIPALREIASLYYLTHPRAAIYYLRVQVRVYGWLALVGRRRWTGRL